MKEAIRKAIKGGWIPKGEEWHKITDWRFEDGLFSVYALDGKHHRVKEHYLQEQILLDPLFWQALGKAEGWEGKIVAMERTYVVEQLYWKYQWHSFIDHLAAGRDIDSFFQELLSSNQPEDE